MGGGGGGGGGGGSGRIIQVDRAADRPAHTIIYCHCWQSRGGGYNSRLTEEH